MTRYAREGSESMTLKELSQLYWLNREIEADKERLGELRQKIGAPQSATISGMPGGGSRGSGMERYIAEIVDLEAIIRAKITQCMHERARLERYISGISDSLTRQIFTLRFVDGLSWRQVAFSVGGGNSEDSVKKTVYRHIRKAEGHSSASSGV